MIATKRFGWFDRALQYHEVVQVWAKIPATETWIIVSAQPVAIDPHSVPDCPTRTV